MDTARSFPFWSIANLSSPLRKVILTSLVFILCYQGARLAFILGIPPDQTASFWSPTAILIAVLLLVPRRIWPPVIAAGVVAMTLADLRDGVPIGVEIWLTLGCMTEVTVAMWGLSLLFRGTPQLTSAKALAKYLVVGVILAPLVAGLVGAIPSVPGGYWVQWRLWFFADALAFLTLTPAILTWYCAGRAWAHKPKNFLELACLMSLLGLFGYLTFNGAGQREQPALLYSLVPLFLWAALRLGLKGVSTSIVVVALLSIWGAAHGRGPFANLGPLNSVLSLQLFLFFAAMPFMFLAVLVEEQKHAEGALRKSEEKFSKAFRESPIALSLSSVKDHCYIEVNETFEHRTGWRRDEVIGRTPLDIGLWTDSVQRDDFQRRLLNEGRVRNFEISNRTKNDEVRTGLGSAELIEIDGQPCALTAVADITDLKQAEAALRESEERFRLVANTAPVMIWMTGADKLCTYVNQPCVEFTKQPAEALLGKGWVDGIHPDDLARSWDAYSTAFDQHQPFRMEYRFRRHDGEYRWVIASGVPRFNADGSFGGYIGSAIDMTERKRAEEALERSQRYLSQSERLAQIGSWAWDVRTRETFWSEELFNILGYDPEKTKPSLSNYLARVHPEDRSRAGQKIEEEASGMEIVSDYRIVLPEGTMKHLQAIGHPIRNASGEVVEVVGTTVDVTKRKLAEEMLSNVSQKLIEAQEQERTRIGRELHDDINQRLAMLLIGLGQLKDNPADLRTRLQMLQSEATELSNDVQVLSHELHSSKLEYLGVIPGIKSWCEEFGERQAMEIDFTSDVSTAMPFDVGLSLFRVLQEALHNSLKHSGGKRVEVRLMEHSNEFHLFVIDHGRGFDVEAAIRGRGLGLTSMRERVRLLNGTITIESKPMGGTAVRVRVPVESGPRAQSAAG